MEDGPRQPVGRYVPLDGEAVDIFRLLDQLEELPERAKHLPFNTLVNFDHEQFYYLVLKIRANLPDDMKKAQRVARDSERIVDEARDAAVQQLESGRAEAAKVVDSARAEAERSIASSQKEATRQVETARDEARRIVEAAQLQAARLVEQSEVHQMATAQAHEILRRAETESNEIRKGADEYARDVLTNIEGVIAKAMATVQRGKELLDTARN